MANKTKLGCKATERKNKSFEGRYGMKHGEWVSFKRQARKEGRGKEIAQRAQKAYAIFIAARI